MRHLRLSLTDFVTRGVINCDSSERMAFRESRCWLAAVPMMPTDLGRDETSGKLAR